jgi:hypothetical protein
VLDKYVYTHSEYVILIAFPLQQLLRERAPVLRHTYIACLVQSFKFGLYVLLIEELLESLTVFGNQKSCPEFYSALFQSSLLVAAYEASRNLNAVAITLATIRCNIESYVYIIYS